MSDTTEDNILKTLNEGADQDNNDQTDVNEGQSADQAGGKGENEDQLTSTLDKAAGDDTPAPAKGQKGQPKSANRPQDLVDEKGAVIATGGRERRFYETAHREKVRADKLDNQLRYAQTRLGALESANSIGTQLGLSPQELMTGAHLMASLKADPVAAAKYILTQVQAAGHNIEGIGSGGVDMKALRSMLSEALHPFTQERENKAFEAQARHEATEVYTDFIGRYPDARVHESIIARLLEQDDKLSPEAAYYKLRSFYSERGLDFTKPLHVLQAELDKRSQQQSKGVRGNSIPSGGASEQNITSSNEASFSANARTEDIVRAAMRDSGMNVNF